MKISHTGDFALHPKIDPSHLDTFSFQGFVHVTRKEIQIDCRHRWFDHKNCFALVQAVKGIGEKRKYKKKKLIIDLSRTTFQDFDVQQLCETIFKQEQLRNALVELDLSHTAITKISLPFLKRLVEACPNISSLDISITYVSNQDFENVFDGLNESLLQKVEFSVY